MFKISYVDAVQECLVLCVLIGLGYLSGKIKLFSVVDVSCIRRALYLICIPAMLFKQIANQQLTADVWHPLLNSFLVELTIHIIMALVVFLAPFRNKYYAFLEGIFSFAYVNFVFFAFPLVRILYGQKYEYIPVIASIVHFIIEPPIHSLLILIKEKKEKEDEEHHHTSEEEERREEEQDIEMEGFEGEIPQKDSNDSHEEDVENPEKPKEEPTPIWKTVLFMIVTPLLVCAILGIIWSGTKVTLPSVINTFVGYLENSVVATGLFSIGVFMSDHPFFGFNWVVVGIFLAIHFIVMPLISALWSFVLGVDHRLAQIMTLAHALPTGLTGYVMSINTGHGLNSASYTFFWSNILFLPVYMIWVAVFNETGLFSFDQ